ncbi:MAG: NAD(P)-dependent oxidoreductase, partial [Firmicutes bacterium]|nr:NAD(P)-dependent oxidoreductase [Bacillota bacterium]
MKVFLIGGTGLLGNAAAKELIARGHEVFAMALPPCPSGADLPEKMELEYGNYEKLSDDELRARLAGCEGLVFAGGIDERIEAPPSIYDLFVAHNNTPLKRLLTLAKVCGVKHVAVCGSYFSYFTKIRPEEEFPRWHPYIKCRMEQEEMCLSFADENFDVAILELPYIFGAMQGRKPVWTFVVEMFRKLKPWTFFCKGGTTMV